MFAPKTYYLAQIKNQLIYILNYVSII